MKLPEDKEVKDLASYYGINTRGKLLNWVKPLNPNAAIHYYVDGKLKHMRVIHIIKILKYL